MTVNDFCVIIARKEGKKFNLPISQIKEVVRIVREILLYKLGIDIYRLIRLLPYRKPQWSKWGDTRHSGISVELGHKK